MESKLLGRGALLQRWPSNQLKFRIVPMAHLVQDHKMNKLETTLLVSNSCSQLMAISWIRFKEPVPSQTPVQWSASQWYLRLYALHSSKSWCCFLLNCSLQLISMQAVKTGVNRDNTAKWKLKHWKKTLLTHSAAFVDCVVVCLLVPYQFSCPTWPTSVSHTFKYKPPSSFPVNYKHFFPS